MNQFIGLDGHKKSCTFVVINEKGKVKRKAVLPTDEKQLVEFVKSIPGRRHLCIEEGTQSHWFYEIFSDHVHDLAIVQGRKSPGNKDDERDARNLAERFRTSRQFWCYCGLAIVGRSSANWVQKPNGELSRVKINQTRGLNQNFNHMAKAIFKGAAVTVLTSMPTEPLRADYDRLLANGTKPNLARLTLARKIAALVLAMWKNKEACDPGKYRVTSI